MYSTVHTVLFDYSYYYHPTAFVATDLLTVCEDVSRYIFIVCIVGGRHSIKLHPIQSHPIHLNPWLNE